VKRAASAAEALRKLTAVRARRDALLAGAAVACGALLFPSFDVFERVSPALLRFESMQLDDLLLTSFLAVAAASWFAHRRWQESSRQLAALRRSEQENARYVQRLEELSAQLVQTEQRERERLAEALHDEVSQTLYACRLELDALTALLPRPPARRRAVAASALVSHAMDQARRLTADLSPPILHDLGLPSAIEWLLPRLQARHGLALRFDAGPAWARIPHRCHAAVFQSVQELVVNACKHAGARNAVVSAALDGELTVRVEVRDDGHGFDRARSGSDGFGLFSIERRMAHLHGRLDIRSQPGCGTTATLTLPAFADDADQDHLAGLAS
jgi:signal transduction histidine kinase